MLRDSFSDLAYRLRALVSRSSAERSMAEEMQFHVDREAERLIVDGMTREEAQRTARVAFGGVEQMKEAARDAWGTRSLDELRRDVVYAFRLTRKQPGFSTIVTLSLALGLGATLTVFNLTYNVLYAPLALPHPEQLVAPMRITKTDRSREFSWSEVQSLRAASGVGVLAASRGASSVAISVGERPEFINLHFVDGDYFSVVGARALHGRLISPHDDATSAPVVVLSYDFAEQLFPGDSAIVGRIVSIRGAPFSVIGITPKSYRGVEFPGWFTAAIPIGSVSLLGAQGVGSDNRGIPYGRGDDRLTDLRAFDLIGRVAINPDAARSALAGTFARCCARALNGEREILDLVDSRRGAPGGKGDVRNKVRFTLAMILTGMALVLVVVCCNIASLLLVRASARQREIAVRLSLGASRGRLGWQLIAENLPAAMGGGVAGLFLAAWFTGGFIRSLPSDFDQIAAMLEFSYNPVLLAVTAGLTLACTLAFSVYPALRATRQPLASALRLDSHASRSRGQGTTARGVVVAQISVTVVLVTAAGLLSASLVNVARVDGGFATDHVLLVGIGTRSTTYERQGVVPVVEPIARRVEQLPGVRSATMATLLPLYGGSNLFVDVEIPGYATATDESPSARVIAMRPGYFAASGTPLRLGRDFDATDVGTGQPAVIVNAAFVRRYFSDRDPLGKTFRAALSGRRGELTTLRVVGVSGDVTYESLKERPEPIFYTSLGQVPGHWGNAALLVRTIGPPLQFARTVLKAIEGAAPGIEVRRVRDMQAQRDIATTPDRLTARLAVFVSVMALLLSAVGLYGVVAFSVSRRTSEIGIRLALGAGTRAVLWLVSRETVWLVGIGVIIGSVLSIGASGAMASQFFGVDAHDPTVTVGAIVLLAAVGLVASILPALRATRIDPKIALNAD
jgi:putative ABC transport system permease protein